ncbi:N-(5'phosphoribosyl)anthranilate (PRA) isomerase family protein [Mycobacterium kansasii]|uniref:N-(5'-phosphoribosyl)anthranilate isomerase n=1 Tax=Mycobacterium kansasii TaxID=1768 RepID=A0A1V3WFZ2_MYCKA|nr:N-(5'phosphoribosyl)anthranilate (PRA) isomerase family protein [Mycobacterium kansasii]
MNPAVRVKICGIGAPEDLVAAVAAGADAIGLIVGTTHHSEDELDIEQARHLAAATPVFVSAVLVTHLTDASRIVEVADLLGVETIQAHGNLSSAAARELWRHRANRRIIRTVHVTGPHSLDEADQAAAAAHAVLLDSRTETRLGGTGLTHDWTISRRIVERLHPLPVILAGGLAADNVGQAIHAVRPFGVDANSRLKAATGRKDPTSCAAFVTAATASSIG